MMSEPVARAVLFDADGVLQHPRAGWIDRLAAGVGDRFPDDVFAAEQEALTGERWFSDVLAQLLEERGVEADVDDLLRLWEDVDVDADAWAVVDDVRRRGVVTALATNQHDHRMRFMRHDLAYDGATDRAYYSCEIGARKPDPAFFHHVLDDLRLGADEAVFVDDSAANVDAARALGLRVVHHDPAAGAAAVRASLEPFLPPR